MAGKKTASSTFNDLLQSGAYIHGIRPMLSGTRRLLMTKEQAIELAAYILTVVMTTKADDEIEITGQQQQKIEVSLIRHGSKSPKTKTQTNKSSDDVSDKERAKRPPARGRLSL
jgi:hypothetical protein